MPNLSGDGKANFASIVGGNQEEVLEYIMKMTIR